jgi:hypothetical protein
MNSIVSRAFALVASSAFLFSAALADEQSDAIKTAAMHYIFQETSVKDPIVTIEKIIPGFARVGIRSKSNITDPVTAFLRGSGENWSVVTFGTEVTASDLSEVGVPSSLAK